MKRPTSSARPRKPGRRWHIPPPLIHGSEPLEGGVILQEADDEAGVLLWQASRDVMLWATSEPARRTEAFSPAAAPRWTAFARRSLSGADDRLHAALRTVHQLLAQPTALRDEQVARACRLLSEWAEERGRLGTALAFAQNAALATPRDAGAAFWVATLAVRLGDHARAEVWFRRAIGLARQSRNWRMYSRSFSGLGNLYMRRGNLPGARRLHIRALRGARRGGMRREQATALHDLFAVAIESANILEAERLARQALEAYGTRNRRVHVLAHDVAYFWMEQGHFYRALPVFQAVLPLIERPVERIFVIADIARAAGGVGDAATAHSAADEVWAFARQPDSGPGAGSALLEVARAFLSLGDSARARDAARHALANAVEHRESKVRFAAEALLDSLLHHAPEAPPTQPGPLHHEPEAGDELAARFVRTLEGIAGATP